jgi:23S rRNA pseudouridine955/2504/2580 synthase
MEEIIIDVKTENQRLDKYLKRYLPNAGAGFLYRMLREKKIKVNGKKADGSYVLKNKDSVNIFFSEETLEKFKGTAANNSFSGGISDSVSEADRFAKRVIYEDNGVLIYDKPAGMLSQRAGQDDASACEHLINYLKHSGFLDETSIRLFKPSAVNRLDRNTSGLLVCAKTLPAAQTLSEMFKNRSLEKHYLALVFGRVSEKSHSRAYLKKDGKTNKVEISDRPRTGYTPIETIYEPIGYTKNATLLDVELITGKSHQIRAHLSAEGHPLAGDKKYAQGGSAGIVLKRQFLHAYKLIFPKCAGSLEGISEKTFTAPLPKELKDVLDGKLNVTDSRYEGII